MPKETKWKKFWPPERLPEEESAQQRVVVKDGTAGFKCDDEFLVTWVKDDGAADLQGVEVGMRLTKWMDENLAVTSWLQMATIVKEAAKPWTFTFVEPIEGRYDGYYNFPTKAERTAIDFHSESVRRLIVQFASSSQLANIKAGNAPGGTLKRRVEGKVGEVACWIDAVYWKPFTATMRIANHSELAPPRQNNSYLRAWISGRIKTAQRAGELLDEKKREIMRGVAPEKYGQVPYAFNHPTPEERKWLTADGQKALRAGATAARRLARTDGPAAQEKRRLILADAYDMALALKLADDMMDKIRMLPNSFRASYKPALLSFMTDTAFHAFRYRLSSAIVADSEYAADAKTGYRLGSECADADYRIRLRAMAIAFGRANNREALVHDLAVLLLVRNQRKHGKPGKLIDDLSCQTELDMDVGTEWQGSLDRIENYRRGGLHLLVWNGRLILLKLQPFCMDHLKETLRAAGYEPNRSKDYHGYMRYRTYCDQLEPANVDTVMAHINSKKFTKKLQSYKQTEIGRAHV